MLRPRSSTRQAALLKAELNSRIRDLAQIQYDYGASILKDSRSRRMLKAPSRARATGVASSAVAILDHKFAPNVLGESFASDYGIPPVTVAMIAAHQSAEYDSPER